MTVLGYIRGMDGHQAAQQWVDGYEPIPEYDIAAGVVHYPEGDVKMPLAEYVGMHVGCPHQVRYEALVMAVLHLYLSLPTGWIGWGSRRVVAPLMKMLVAIDNRPEYRGVPWAK